MPAIFWGDVVVALRPGSISSRKSYNTAAAAAGVVGLEMNQRMFN